MCILFYCLVLQYFGCSNNEFLQRTISHSSSLNLINLVAPESRIMALMCQTCAQVCCKNKTVLEALPKMEHCVSIAPARADRGSDPSGNHNKNTKATRLANHHAQDVIVLQAIAEESFKGTPFCTLLS